MGSDKNKLSAEDIYNGILEHLSVSDYEEDVQTTKTQIVDEEIYFSRCFDIINNWKRDLKYEKANEKIFSFKRFYDIISSLPSAKDKRDAIKNLYISENPKLALIFHRRLESITDNDLESLEAETKLLELWSKFFKEDKEE